MFDGSISPYTLIPEDMKREIGLFSDLKGAGKMANLGRNWYPLARGDELWCNFAHLLGITRGESDLGTPFYSLAKSHVVAIGKFATRFVKEFPPNGLIKDPQSLIASKLLQEEISVANTVSLEACLLRRWVLLVSLAKQPSFVKELLDQEFSTENNRQIKEWLQVRDTLAVWRVFAEGANLEATFPDLTDINSLDEAKEIIKEFEAFCVENKEGLKSLRALNLRFLHLTHLPKEIGFCQNLETIDAGCNFLRALPRSIGELPHLKQLTLSSNRFRNIPAEIFSLPKLQEIDLSKNFLSEIPREICKLVTLTSLSLSDNSIKQIPDELGALLQLKQLYLGHNQLESLPDSLVTLGQLTNLGLYANKFGTQPQVVNLMSNLKRVSIFDNPLAPRDWSLRSDINT